MISHRLRIGVRRVVPPERVSRTTTRGTGRNCSGLLKTHAALALKVDAICDDLVKLVGTYSLCLPRVSVVNIAISNVFESLLDCDDWFKFGRTDRSVEIIGL